MHPFLELLEDLARSADRTEQEAALRRYLNAAHPGDHSGAALLLAGRRPRRVASYGDLRKWIGEAADLPPWLVDLSMQTAGDTPEGLALLLPRANVETAPTLGELVRQVNELASAGPARRSAAVLHLLRALPVSGRVLLLRLVAGTFRTPIGRSLLFRVLAQHTGLPEGNVAYRIEYMDPGDPGILGGGLPAGDRGGPPHDFMTIQPAPDDLHGLGGPSAWRVEWLPRGTRCQIIRRTGSVAVWKGEYVPVRSRTEVHAQAAALPEGTVLEGVLEERRRSAVVHLLDLREDGGEDTSALPPQSRLRRMAEIIPRGSSLFRLPEPLAAGAWEDVLRHREDVRASGWAGVLLTPLAQSPLGGQPRAARLLLSPARHTIDMVLLYAETDAHTGRSGYTLAVRDADQLVQAATLAPDSINENAGEIEAFIREHTIERFGPVRRVAPSLVFTVAFDGVVPSRRRRSGVRLLDPVILCWKQGSDPGQIARLEDLRGLLREEEREAAYGTARGK